MKTTLEIKFFARTLQTQIMKLMNLLHLI